MKYTSEIEINLPEEKVTALFDDPQNLHQWMKGLQKFEHLSGTPGQPGAKSRLTFRTGKRELIMIETITVRNLPEEFSGTYEAKGVLNLVKNRFERLPGNRTRYITENEFRFSGFMKVLAWVMPSAFRKETIKHMEAFRRFAEGEK